MTSKTELPIPPADAAAVEWQEHPRFANVLVKTLLTSTENPLANVNLVKVLPGNEISRHHHPKEIETVFVLAGHSKLTLGDIEVPFNAGQVVAIPKGLDHALVNVGQEPVELITFFTPPIV